MEISCRSTCHLMVCPLPGGCLKLVTVCLPSLSLQLDPVVSAVEQMLTAERGSNSMCERHEVVDECGRESRQCAYVDSQYYCGGSKMRSRVSGVVRQGYTCFHLIAPYANSKEVTEAPIQRFQGYYRSRWLPTNRVPEHRTSRMWQGSNQQERSL